MAKASAAGATQYVAAGAPVPVDVPADVRLVGPGAPAEVAEAPKPEPVRASEPRARRARTGAGS